MCYLTFISLPRPRVSKLAGDGAGAERPLRGMKRSGCPVNKGALQAAAPQGDYCELRTYWVLARISVAQCERYGRISCRWLPDTKEKNSPNGLFFFFAILLFSIFPGLSCPAKLAGDIAKLSASCGRCSETAQYPAATYLPISSHEKLFHNLIQLR